MGFLDFIGIDDDTFLWLVGGIALGVAIYAVATQTGLFTAYAKAGVTNAEKWIIERDDEGRLVGATIHRNVSV